MWVVSFFVFTAFGSVSTRFGLFVLVLSLERAKYWHLWRHAPLAMAIHQLFFRGRIAFCDTGRVHHATSFCKRAKAFPSNHPGDGNCFPYPFLLGQIDFCCSGPKLPTRRRCTCPRLGLPLFEILFSNIHPEEQNTCRRPRQSHTIRQPKILTCVFFGLL